MPRSRRSGPSGARGGVAPSSPSSSGRATDEPSPMNDAPPTPPGAGEGDGYTDVRERLVSMGYLSRPLERYVLGGVARPGSFLRRHAAVSLRVALAAGPLLGLLFALAVVVANRPRFSHASDFLVLAGGFTVVFGAAVFLLELV